MYAAVEDMSIATMQTLCYIINNGCTGYDSMKNSVGDWICNTRTFLGPGRKGIVSVFAHGGDAKGVTISGLKYNMDNGNLFPATCQKRESATNLSALPHPSR